MRVISGLAALVLLVSLSGCGGDSESDAAPPAEATAAASDGAPDSSDAEPLGDLGDSCTAAAAAFNADDVNDAIQNGDIDSAIAAYDELAAQAPAEIADDVATVRDGLVAVRDAIAGSGLDDDIVEAFLGGDSSAMADLGPEDIGALQKVSEDLTDFITSTDYIEAAQHLVTYYAENCAG